MLLGNVLDAGIATEGPEDVARVEVFFLEIVGAPLVAPVAEGIDDRREVETGGGKGIEVAAAILGRFSLDDARGFQGAEAVDQQVLRHARKAAVEESEALGTVNELSQDKRCPSFGEGFGGEGYGAELAVG